MIGSESTGEAFYSSMSNLRSNCIKVSSHVSLPISKFLPSKRGSEPSILAIALSGEAYDPMSNNALIPIVRIDDTRGGVN